MQSLWMMFAAFVFALMGVCVKFASASYSTAEIVMYRGLIGAAFLYAMVRLQNGTLATPFPWHHLWRGLIGVSALWMWFYAIAYLSLATAMTLNYTAPIWIAGMMFVIGWWRGGRRFEWGLALAIVVSFVGVTLLLQPAFHAEQWLAGSVALLSGLLSAIAYLQVRQLGKRGEPEYRVVFYFSATCAVVGLLGTILLGLSAHFASDAAPLLIWHTHSLNGALLLLAIGLSAAIAQMAMTRAYRLGRTMVTANLQYSGMIFSSFWGVVIWDDALGRLGWFGIALIFMSGMTATVLSLRGAPRLALGPPG